jgi:hypothetical protein
VLEYDRRRGYLPSGTPYAAWLWYHLHELGVWPEAFPISDLAGEALEDYDYLCETAVPMRLDLLREIAGALKALAKVE